MSVQTSASRPAGKSLGAALLGLVVTLLIFVAIFHSFLIAPIFLLLAAFLVFVALRPKGEKSSGPRPAASEGNHGFGAGAQ